MGLKSPYPGLRNTSQPSSHWLSFNVTIHNALPTWFPHDHLKTVLALLLSPGFEYHKYLVPLNIFRGWVCPAHFDFIKIVRHISFFLSLFSKTQPNHWTKRMTSTRLVHVILNLGRRVPGLPIRDCAGSCNSSVQRRTTVRAIVSTAEAIFERLLFLVSGLRKFGLEPTVRVLPHPHRSRTSYFLISVQYIFRTAPECVLSARFTK